LFWLGRLAAQGEASRHDNLGASMNLYGCTDSCTAANQRGRLKRFPQPGGQLCRALEVEQAQDLGGGGFVQGAAAAVELAECHLGGFSGLAAGFTAGSTH
jgi:hypothetical protein